MELAPFAVMRGCQGFTGPYPSAFLDKHYIKNWCAKVIEELILPKIIVQRSLNINELGEWMKDTLKRTAEIYLSYT
jgi:hypothetical protein